MGGWVRSPTVTSAHLQTFVLTDKAAVTKCSFPQIRQHDDAMKMDGEDEGDGVQGLGEVLLQEVHEAVGGRVVGRHLRVVLQLGFDLLRQLLPEFNAVGRRRTVVRDDVNSSLNALHRAAAFSWSFLSPPSSSYAEEGCGEQLKAPVRSCVTHPHWS